MNINKYQPKWISTLLLMTSLIVGCEVGTEDPSDDNGDGSTSTSGTTTPPIIETNETDNSTGPTTTAPTVGDYSLSLSDQIVNLTEGSNVSVIVQLLRNNGYAGQVNVSAEAISQSDEAQISWKFSSTKIAPNENSTSINLALDYAVLPIQPQERTFRIIATDGSTQRTTELNINVTPTDKPDVYLLIGQSNMVGSSEKNAKQAGVAGVDASVNAIRQLNVTGNDQGNFDTTASFENVDAIAVAEPRFTNALDPLHDGYDVGINGKRGTSVGLGLSFAKRAIENTNASEIYLVPAAWEDTGFCRRERTALKLFEGSLGWNATPKTAPELSGTLLYKRALKRTNLTLQGIGGILRGILWHQGEADSSNDICAQMYAQNLAEMVASLRSNIVRDARGANARGENANVPFVVGTMSKGGPYNNPTGPRLIVDGVHRNIAQLIPFSSYVDNDDLVPPAYPCGSDGDCIHFGSAAYRLMGSRYYDQLLEAAIGQ